MAHASTSCATRAFASTTIAVADVLEEFKDFEPQDDFVVHAKDLISSNGDEFGD
jgi:hypothetical protein